MTYIYTPVLQEVCWSASDVDSHDLLEEVCAGQVSDVSIPYMAAEAVFSTDEGTLPGTQQFHYQTDHGKKALSSWALTLSSINP